MKTKKHNIIWALLLCVTIAFGQKQEKLIDKTVEIDKNFKVNKGAVVEINATHTDVTVELWNKNTVSVFGVWEVEGIPQKEVEDNFKSWKFEALGNKDKVVITSKSDGGYYEHFNVFDDMDFDFDFEGISHIGEMFDGDFFSAVIPPLPNFPEPDMPKMEGLDFDNEAYEKDKEGYMKEFQMRQEKWEKEFEEKLEPQILAYEEKMKKWEEEMEPKMKAYEGKMQEWEKEMEPKLKAYEKKMEAWGKEFEEKFAPQMEEFGKKMEEWGENFARNFENHTEGHEVNVDKEKIKIEQKKLEKMEAKMKEMEEDIEKKYVEKMKEKGAENSRNFKIKKRLLIKMPKNAFLKIDAKHGEITLPDNVKLVE